MIYDKYRGKKIPILNVLRLLHGRCSTSNNVRELIGQSLLAEDDKVLKENTSVI
jgi:hypothetical protein